MSEALFDRLEAGRVRPTDLARGPWSPEALHGGPVAALVAGAAEQAGRFQADGLTPVRLTLDLVRPVPVAALVVETEVVRPGRKVRLVEVRVSAGGVLVTSGDVLAIRAAGVEVPAAPVELGPTGPDTVGPADIDAAMEGVAPYRAFHNNGVEHRFVAGGFGQPGPATDWIRLAVPVVSDEPASPFQRVVAAADFGNGISGIASFDELTYINPDLTVLLHRLPQGEWVCLDATTRLAPDGHGLAESELWDEHGHLGRSAQTLIVEAR